jgi:Homeodomain-like domain-containing protein
MTHLQQDVARVLALRHEGLTGVEIAARTGIPRRTVSDWLRGKLSQRAWHAADGVRACVACGAESHELTNVRTSYVYLLGVYLGDVFGALTTLGSVSIAQNTFREVPATEFAAWSRSCRRGNELLQRALEAGGGVRDVRHRVAIAEQAEVDTAVVAQDAH